MFVTSLPLSMVENLYVGTAVLHCARAHYSAVHSVSVFRQPCVLNVGQCTTGFAQGIRRACPQVDTGTRS